MIHIRHTTISNWSARRRASHESARLLPPAARRIDELDEFDEFVFLKKSFTIK
jgi:hypothetical protein